MFDRNSVLTLLGEHFWDDIEIFTIECIQEFAEEDLEAIFDGNLVDYADLDTIDELKVVGVEVEEDGDIEIVSGQLMLEALVDGFVHWDGEERYIDSSNVKMYYEFRFETRDGKVISEIELDWR